MSDIKGVFKNGWHPKGKDGGKESWRGDYKGINQVASWVGKGKQPGSNADSSSHVSRPLADLKDPSSFGAPPRNVNYHGGAALPNEITPHTGGIGAPLTQREIESSHQAVSATHEDRQDNGRPAPPPLPFRSDHTGLKTDNLPPPPVRNGVAAHHAESPRSTKPGPNLPPRLPSRQNTAPSPVDPISPPPAYGSAAPQSKSSIPALNQSAMSRLGGAGISVPGLGIGNKNSSSQAKDNDNNNNNNNNNPWSNEASQNNSMSELSSRFKKFNTNAIIPKQDATGTTTTSTTSPSTDTPPPPTWAQTQSSLKTAQNFHKDPTSVSLADAQNAAATAQQAHTNAQAFRARHSDKIDAAERKAIAINKRYNVAGRLNRFLEDANDQPDQGQQGQQGQQQQPPVPPTHPSVATTTQAQTQGQAPAAYQRTSPPPPVPAPRRTAQQATSPITDSSQSDNNLHTSIGRKPPPPPPPKKPGNLQAPPPVPLGTKPNFS